MNTGPIIDMHVHAYDSHPMFGTSFVNTVTGDVLKASPDADTHVQETVEAFRRFGIVRAMVSGSEEGLAALQRAAPDVVLPGYPIEDADRIDKDEIRGLRLDRGLQVLGEVAVQYNGTSPADARVRTLFEVAYEFDVPIAYHMHPGPPGAAYIGMPKMRAALGNPLFLEDALAAHPTVRVYVMHAGWPFLDEMIALLYAHPQVYVDVGVIAWSQPREEFHSYLRRLVGAGYGDRIMFGSDQMVWPKTIEMSITAIDEAEFLTDEQRRGIFHDNAARFLRLPRSVPTDQDSRGVPNLVEVDG